jgi:ankyrin repeat protein
LLQPLFEYSPPNGQTEKTPTKEQVRSSQKTNQPKRSSGLSSQLEKRPKLDHGSSQSATDELQDGYKDQFGFTDSNLSAPNFDYPDPKSYYTNYASLYPDHYMYGYHQNLPPPAQSQVALAATEPSAERHRTTIMALFVNSGNNSNYEILYPHSILPSDFDIDLVLDNQGHTALHWAAALGNIHLLTLLVQKGAQIDRLNYSGESALTRSVMVSYNHDKLSFADLVTSLKDTIFIPDKKCRTVLHHICLSANQKTNQACIYYMETILEYIASVSYDEAMSSQLIHSEGTSSLSRRLKALINAVDVCGDSPVNIAARLGNRNIFDQLVQAGADVNIANTSGLKPIDFGFEAPQKNAQVF